VVRALDVAALSGGSAAAALALVATGSRVDGPRSGGYRSRMPVWADGGTLDERPRWNS